MNPRTCRALGALLQYPTPELATAAPELHSALTGEALPADTASGLQRFLDELTSTPLLDLEERYVSTFDRTPRHSLYLLEHLYSDEPKRSAAMVELRRHFGACGFPAPADELPDYLPLLCEFLSLVPAEVARATATPLLPAIALVGQRLSEENSSYAPVFAALLDSIDARTPGATEETP